MADYELTAQSWPVRAIHVNTRLSIVQEPAEPSGEGDEKRPKRIKTKSTYTNETRRANGQA